MASGMACMEKQIDSCRALLEVFQDERRTYLEGAAPPALEQVQQTLRHKQQLVEVIEACREAARRAPAEARGTPDEERCRQMIGELGSLLEKLLVIDQENERTLRTLLQQSSTVGSVAAATDGGTRRRPGLQQRLPFCPDDAREQARQQVADRRRRKIKYV